MPFEHSSKIALIGESGQICDLHNTLFSTIEKFHGFVNAEFADVFAKGETAEILSKPAGHIVRMEIDGAGYLFEIETIVSVDLVLDDLFELPRPVRRFFRGCYLLSYEPVEYL